MNHPLLLILIILLSMPFVSAQTEEAPLLLDWSKLDCDKGTYYGKPISQVQAKVPSDLVDLLNNERITLDITGKATISGDVKNGLLQNVKCGLNNNASMYVRMTPSSIEAIANSSYPAKTFKELKSKGEIDITPTDGVGFLKIFFMNLVLMFV